MVLRRPIYLDYMATTPIDPRVMDKMMAYMGPEGHFGNPASVTHGYGQMAAVAVDEARMQVATLIGASPDEMVFTSGATEANNLAILGAAQFYQRKGRHLITLSTEHKSVLDSFHHLEHLGFDVTYLDPNSNGLLDTKTLLDALRPETILVSVMQVNNEIGVIQDISALGQCLKNKGIVFHVDAAQSAGKLPIDLHALPVDLMSFSAHKIYGPKGIGALYVRQKPRIRLLPQSFGGGHEGGLRSGTLPTHQIVGMGEACAMAGELRAAEQTRILNLRNQLWAGIQHLPGVALNGDASARVPGNLNIRFDGLENKALLMALHELALSTTSACVSSKTTPSYVLRAIGLSATAAQSSIRLSLGRFTTEEDVLRTIAIFCYEIPRLHAGSIQ